MSGQAAKARHAEVGTDTTRLEQPRVARKMVLSSPALRDSLREIAARTGVSEKKIEREAAACLRELVPGSSKLGYRLLIRFARFVYQRGYDREIACDAAEIDRYRELARQHPVALVGNHRSQVDGFAMYSAMHDHGLPHPFTFGGINMKLPLMGTILKGSKLIFIRRAFADNAVYKAVLRAYIDFLVEHRFPLFWAIEGTRSRTGKLSAPRFGLISWVVDAQLRASGEDLFLVPVAVSYEQISDVQSYSEEQRGMKKKPENFRWLVKYLAGFKHNLGQITVRFGEGVSLQQHMGQIRASTPEIMDFRDKVVLKMAVAACLGLNKVTPVTVPSLVCLVLLQAAPRAVTQSELRREFLQLVDYVKAHKWPATFNLDDKAVSALQRSLDSLAVNGVIECYERGAEPVYSIAHGKDLSASYYRNNSIHFFVLGAIAELALTKALAQQVPTYREDTFWREVGHLRNMFKFEFYFAPQGQLENEIRADLDLRCPGWQALLASPNPYPGREIKAVTPLLCHGVLEPFLDAYHLVAEKLLSLAPGSSFDQGSFLDLCLFEAEQLYRLRRIAHQETVAKPMFESGLLVAKNRGLLDDAVDDARLFSRRAEFLQELNDLLDRLRDIRHIAASRRSGAKGAKGDGAN